MMEDKGWIPWLIAALGILWALVKSFGNREVERYDGGLARIAKMERDNVTREELNDLLDRREEERRRMHAENREVLDRIEDKIDKRHGELNDLAIRVAIIERERAAGGQRAPR